MRVYISGPITGIAEGNKPAFDAMESELLGMGHTPVNPMKLNHDHDKSWEAFMREDIKALMDCDAFVLLPGWEGSRGAKIEYQVATAIGIPLIG